MQSELKPEKIKSVILINDLSDYSVLFQPLTAETIGLNETAVSIWNLLDGKKSIRDIADEIAVKFSINNSTALSDVSKFADTLYRRLFIVKSRDESKKFEDIL